MPQREWYVGMSVQVGGPETNNGPRYLLLLGQKGLGGHSAVSTGKAALGEGPQPARARGDREGERAHIAEVFMPLYGLMCTPHHCQFFILKPSPPALQNASELGD